MDVIEELSGVKFVPYTEPVKIEPTTTSLQGIDEWLTTVGSIFDRGMDIYGAFEGRKRANDIIRSEQTTPKSTEPIPIATYGKATAVAVAQEFKKPLVIGATLFVVLGILAIYKPRFLW